MSKYGLILYNMNHVSTYETTLRIINSCVDYGLILRNMNHIWTYFLFRIFIQDNALQYLNISITFCSAKYTKPVISNSKIKSKIETKDKSRTQCQYIIHGIKSYKE